MVPGEPRVIRDLDRFVTRALAQRDDAERAGGRERVDQEVEEHGARPAGSAGHETDEHVADVGDRRVGEHSLEVRLRDRHHVADGHRDRRDGPEERRPVEREAPRHHRQHPDQRREGSGL